MKIVVNGEERQEDEGTTIAGLAASLGLEPRSIAVEINREIVKKTVYDSTVLHDGDRLEIVTFVGGG